MSKLNLSKFCVAPGENSLDMNRFSTELRGLYTSKVDYLNRLRKEVELMAEFHQVLYAANTESLLLVLQGMDASGKDGIIRHALSGLNPQGLQVTPFKKPSEDELDQSIFRRHEKALPQKGDVAIWNRSHYEEVLVVRVRPELLELRGLKPKKFGDKFWAQRFEQIQTWEKLVHESGRTHIIKFFLHISHEEQARRLLDRIEDKTKRWKFEEGDMYEREHWDEYQRAFAEALPLTSKDYAPWYVIPADDKKAARLLVAMIVNNHFRRMKLEFPKSRLPDAALERFAKSLRK